MNWKKRQLIGFSVKSMNELIRVIELGINMVEIKLGNFASAGTPLYYYADEKFSVNTEVLQSISSLVCSRNIAVQFHLPLENKVSLKTEKGINIGLKEHHNAAMQRFMILEMIFREYGIGSVITMHPPMVSSKQKQLISENKALNNAKKFFDSLDLLRIKENHCTLIGLENQAIPKKLAGNLGYETEHFKIILRDTRTIGITIDVGHRLLAPGFKVSDFMKLGFPVVNCHFHGNPGILNMDNFNDDLHELPRGRSKGKDGNVKGYKNYIRYFKRHRHPITLEISRLERYSDNEFADFVANLKKETE